MGASRIVSGILACTSILAAEPHLLLPSDLQRMQDWADSAAWAAAARASLINAGEAWPQSHLDRYGLRTLALPDDGGQWTLWYVCPVHGVSLQYQPPSTHRCPVDNRTYSGRPYDQVIYTRRHTDLAAAARDHALAFRLTGNRKYADAAAWILKQYAAKYLTYPIKDVNNRANATSGARATAQTLDEAIWIIPLAWAYDLLADSNILTAEERDSIAKNLLRAAATVIQRNDAGISNWQSWHNAGIGAVGYALEDRDLIRAAIDGKSGFRFQMKNSIAGEGFWYEGAWGYHFYALDALVQLAEMAARNGTDLWQEPGMRGLFTAPLNLSFADGTLPAFNDSNSTSLYSFARLYETAFARLGDGLFASIAAKGSRGRDAWISGAAELPQTSLSDLTSAAYPEAGYSVLRSASDHAVIMKFGPHGGGHGHYDKLGLVSYALGGLLAIDPGTQSYAAPTHDTWDKVTVAHNTMVVDERTQAEATGKLLWMQTGDGFSAASADAGNAYAGVRLNRTVLVTNEYALDLFHAEAADNRGRKFDWVYHNPGITAADLPWKPYSDFPKTNGYQHLTGAQSAQTSDAWKIVFDGLPGASANFGSVFASTANVKGTFQTSREQAANGRFAGKATYEWNGAGYLLYTAAIPAAQLDSVPAGLSVMVYGDGSGHTLALRINDSSDERFVITVGKIDWTGWKNVTIRNLEKGSHYLGNNDGVIDLPLRSFSVELQQSPDAARSGALYFDDVTLLYEQANAAPAITFEIPVRSLRVWMLGEPSTTVVTGDGLGPNLLVPVPFVMARRSGTATDFVSLLEPFEETPGIVSFQRSADGGFRVLGGGFEDRIRIGTEGVVGYERVILAK
ncbi:MAG: heparinase II/III family protein [Candidatus Solibacter usitatus]|nr:heparinase II/III family protein [Candidatus Solibacter usitatus]